MPVFKGNLHAHTTFSDGRRPIDEVIERYRELDYDFLAITDHAEGTLSGVGREALLDQRAKIRAMQAEIGDSLTLMHGVSWAVAILGAASLALQPRV